MNFPRYLLSWGQSWPSLPAHTHTLSLSTYTLTPTIILQIDIYGQACMMHILTKHKQPKGHRKIKRKRGREIKRQDLLILLLQFYIEVWELWQARYIILILHIL